jgi:ABC-type nickel/cobalt efflux system permease component RcnA
LEIDHMLAVTAFVSRRPALGTAARFGFRWGMGHSVAVLALGGLLLLTGLSWPERWERGGEAAVGVMLMLIGAWSLRATRNLHLHPPSEHGDHAHLHTHKGGANSEGQTSGPAAHDHPGPHSHHHQHGRGITLVGMMHGLAGSSAVVALVPVTLVDRLAVGAGYLLAFGLGTTVAMTVFALATAAAMRQAATRSVEWGKRISTAVGLAGVGVGIWWIVRATT